MARNSELPPGSLRLARRQASLTNNTTKPTVQTKGINYSSVSSSRLWKDNSIS